MNRPIHSPPPEIQSAGIAHSERLKSLDALRGFDMFWIAGVDELILTIHNVWPSAAFGIVAAQFVHKEWEGFAFYDLIFPLFIFIVGVTTVLSLDKLLENETKSAVYKRIFRRFFLLYVIALIYNGSFWQEDIRLIGVLQRIAWCYLFTSLLYCNLGLRGLIAVFAALLIGYWAFLSFVPPPGESTPTFAMHRNWSNWFDKHYLPIGDMEPRGWRNEGILSTIPAIASCILGVFAGKFLRNGQCEGKRKAAVFVAVGALLVVLGYFWGLQFPVIKRIWTSSYVLVAGGYSCVLLGVFYFIIDVLNVQKWATPFFWIGSNAIVVYVVTGMVPWRFIQGPLESFGAAGEILGAAIVPFSVIALAFLLHRKRLFLRV
jgi:predicted acyltransferase